jgi:hypothetical protein
MDGETISTIGRERRSNLALQLDLDQFVEYQSANTAPVPEGLSCHFFRSEMRLAAQVARALRELGPQAIGRPNSKSHPILGTADLQPPVAGQLTVPQDTRIDVVTNTVVHDAIG